MTLLTIPPNTKRSKITNLTVNSPATSSKASEATTYPSISHSAITESTFTNLTPSCGISHSTLTRVDLSLTQDTAHPNDTKIKHSAITSSTLTNIAYANHLKASDSTLSNLASITRASVKNSSITGGSTGSTSAKCGSEGCENVIERADIKDSAVTATEIRRCNLDAVRVDWSTLRRVALKECDVENCVILRTELKGMRLRDQVWKNGRLVGPVEEAGEVSAASLTDDTPQARHVPPSPIEPKTKEEEAGQDAVWRRDSGESAGESAYGLHGGDMDRPPAYTP